MASERTIVIAEDAREKLERLSWRTRIAPHEIERHPRSCNERGQLLARRPQREDIGSDLIELQCGSPRSPSLVPPAFGQPSHSASASVSLRTAQVRNRGPHSASPQSETRRNLGLGLQASWDAATSEEA